MITLKANLQLQREAFNVYSIIINQLFFLFMAFVFEYVERTSSFLLVSSSVLLEKSHYYSFSLIFFILSKYLTKHK